MAMTADGSIPELILVQMPWRKKWQPTPVLFPGKSNGWERLQAMLHRVTKNQT